jgi:hypothetical protein
MTHAQGGRPRDAQGPGTVLLSYRVPREPSTPRVGTAGVWLAQPTTRSQERHLATTMAQARASEYAAVRDQAHTAGGTATAGMHGEHAAAVRRLRARLRRISRRDYFPPPERDQAKAAVEELARQAQETAELGL